MKKVEPANSKFDGAVKKSPIENMVIIKIDEKGREQANTAKASSRSNVLL